jgi:hypothetical protein
MIALNETNEYAAEVAFTLFSGISPITGWSFTLGEVQIKLPGGAWTDATLIKIVEKGYGRYAVRLTAAQCLTAGDVYIKAIVAGAQNYYGSDVIGTLGGDIPQSGTGSINFFLPDAVDPFLNPPLTGHTFVLGEVRICLPDTAYADAALVSISEVGYGLYRVNLDATQTLKKGKAFVYASVTGYQPFEGYSTILGIGVSDDDVDVPVPIPVITAPSDLSPVGIYKDLITNAVNRLCEYSKSGDFDFGVYEDNVGLTEFDVPLDGGMG